MHAGAVGDLTALGDWYEAQRPGLGLALADEIARGHRRHCRESSSRARWPGAPVKPEIRRFLLPRFPLALPYLIGRDRVTVLAVAHPRRRPGFWLERAVPRQKP